MRRIIVLFLLGFVCINTLCPNLTYSYTLHSDMPDISFMINQFGKVTDTFKGRKDSLVYLIQDAHCNKYVQNNIYSIIKKLKKEHTHKLTFLGVEGTSGRIDTKILSSLPDKEVKNYLINMLMDKRYLTGAEKYKALFPKDVNLFGIEDKDIYMKNYKFLYESLMYRDKIKHIINQSIDEIKKIRRIFYNPLINNIEIMQDLFRKNGISQKEFIIYLESARKSQKMRSNKEYLNIHLYLESLKLKENLNTDDIRLEALKLLHRLRTIIRHKDIEKLNSYNNNEKYYLYLDFLLLQNNIVYKQTQQNLAGYISYIKKINSIDVLALNQELDDLAHRVKLVIAGKDKALRDLLYYKRYLALMKRYLFVQLSSKELEQWKKGTARFFKIAADIENKMGIGTLFNQNMELLREAEKSVQGFYELADKRNEVMARNFLHEIPQAGIAVIVMGGYHTKRVTEILRSLGIAYKVIQPHIQENENDIYIKRFLEQAEFLNGRINNSNVYASNNALNLISEIRTGKIRDEVFNNIHNILERVYRLKEKRGQDLNKEINAFYNGIQEALPGLEITIQDEFKRQNIYKSIIIKYINYEYNNKIIINYTKGLRVRTKDEHNDNKSQDVSDLINIVKHADIDKMDINTIRQFDRFLSKYHYAKELDKEDVRLLKKIVNAEMKIIDQIYAKMYLKGTKYTHNRCDILVKLLYQIEWSAIILEKNNINGTAHNLANRALNYLRKFKNNKYSYKIRTAAIRSLLMLYTYVQLDKKKAADLHQIQKFYLTKLKYRLLNVENASSNNIFYEVHEPLWELSIIARIIIKNRKYKEQEKFIDEIINTAKNINPKNSAIIQFKNFEMLGSITHLFIVNNYEKKAHELINYFCDLARDETKTLALRRKIIGQLAGIVKLYIRISRNNSANSGVNLKRAEFVTSLIDKIRNEKTMKIEEKKTAEIAAIAMQYLKSGYRKIKEADILINKVKAELGRKKGDIVGKKARKRWQQIKELINAQSYTKVGKVKKREQPQNKLRKKVKPAKKEEPKRIELNKNLLKITTRLTDKGFVDKINKDSSMRDYYIKYIVPEIETLSKIKPDYIYNPNEELIYPLDRLKKNLSEKGFEKDDQNVIKCFDNIKDLFKFIKDVRDFYQGLKKNYESVKEILFECLELIEMDIRHDLSDRAVNRFRYIKNIIFDLPIEKLVYNLRPKLQNIEDLFIKYNQTDSTVYEEFRKIDEIIKRDIQNIYLVSLKGFIKNFKKMGLITIKNSLISFCKRSLKHKHRVILKTPLHIDMDRKLLKFWKLLEKKLFVYVKNNEISTVNRFLQDIDADTCLDSRDKLYSLIRAPMNEFKEILSSNARDIDVLKEFPNVLKALKSAKDVYSYIIRINNNTKISYELKRRGIIAHKNKWNKNKAIKRKVVFVLSSSILNRQYKEIISYFSKAKKYGDDIIVVAKCDKISKRYKYLIQEEFKDLDEENITADYSHRENENFNVKIMVPGGAVYLKKYNLETRKCVETRLLKRAVINIDYIAKQEESAVKDKINRVHTFYPCPWDRKEWLQADQDTALLYKIIENGDLINLKKQAEKISDFKRIINMQDSNGNTLFHVASWLQHYNIIEFLLGNGVNKHFVNLDGKKAVHYLLYNHNAKSLQKCIEHFFLVYKPCATYLERFEYIRAQCTGLITLLLSDLHVKLSEEVDNFSYLARLIKQDPFNSFDLYLNLKLIISILLTDSDTAYNPAFEIYKKEIFKAYIKSSYYYKSVDSIYNTEKMSFEELKEAVKECDESLYKADVYMHEKDYYVLNELGQTLLHKKALKENKCKYSWSELLEHISPNKKDYIIVNNHYNTNNTPVHILAFRCRDNVQNIMLCLKAGYDINNTNVDNNTVLHIASIFSHKNLMKELINIPELNVNIKDVNGKAPIHYILEGVGDTENEYKCLKRLLKRKDLIIDIRNNKNETALHIAVKNNDLQFVKLLLLNGADPCAINNKNLTAFHIAARMKDENQKKNMLELLNLYSKDIKSIKLAGMVNDLMLKKIKIKDKLKKFLVSIELYNITGFKMRSALLNIVSVKGEYIFHNFEILLNIMDSHNLSHDKLQELNFVKEGYKVIKKLRAIHENLTNIFKLADNSEYIDIKDISYIIFNNRYKKEPIPVNVKHLRPLKKAV
ncbi:ankyrin repeat domain-containing protein [bacterium]